MGPCMPPPMPPSLGCRWSESCRAIQRGPMPLPRSARPSPSPTRPRSSGATTSTPSMSARRASCIMTPWFRLLRPASMCSAKVRWPCASTRRGACATPRPPQGTLRRSLDRADDLRLRFHPLADGPAPQPFSQCRAHRTDGQARSRRCWDIGTVAARPSLPAARCRPARRSASASAHRSNGRPSSIAPPSWAVRRAPASPSAARPPGRAGSGAQSVSGRIAAVRRLRSRHGRPRARHCSCRWRRSAPWRNIARSMASRAREASHP